MHCTIKHTRIKSTTFTHRQNIYRIIGKNESFQRCDVDPNTDFYESQGGSATRPIVKRTNFKNIKYNTMRVNTDPTEPKKVLDPDLKRCFSVRKTVLKSQTYLNRI